MPTRHPSETGNEGPLELGSLAVPPTLASILGLGFLANCSWHQRGSPSLWNVGATQGQNCGLEGATEVPALS